MAAALACSHLSIGNIISTGDRSREASNSNERDQSRRVDPLSLPVRFDAHDVRADGGVRQIELHRERVVLRRVLHGMRMAINVRISDFHGVALRGIGDAQMLVLVHRDPSLTVPLCTGSDNEEIAAAWQMWSEIFSLPQLPNEKARE